MEIYFRKCRQEKNSKNVTSDIGFSYARRPKLSYKNGKFIYKKRNTGKI